MTRPDLRALAKSASYAPTNSPNKLDGSLTTGTTARQAAQPPRTTTKEKIKTTGVAGPVSPSLLRQARAILWADEKPCDVEAMCTGLVTVSEANQRGHWSKGAGRAHEQRAAAFQALFHERDGGMWPQSQAIIILTRFGPRALDSDNLARGLKAVRDGVADWLERDDGDEGLMWLYQQHKGKPGVRIQMWRWEP